MDSQTPKTETPKPDQKGFETINNTLNRVEQVLFDSGTDAVAVCFVQSVEDRMNYKLHVAKSNISEEEMVMHLTNICAYTMERRLGFDRSEVKAFIREQFTKKLKAMKISDADIENMLSFLQ